jgi:hypothetical protein
MSADLRELLAADQAELVRALAGLSPTPEGFNGAHLERTSAALAQKRVRAAEKVWPELQLALGTGFAMLFKEYVIDHPAPPTGGPACDAFSFAAFLSSRRQLPPEAQSFWLSLRLHYRCSKNGLSPRRGLGIAWEILHDSGKLLIGLRLGTIREWRFSVPMPRSAHVTHT